MEVEACSSPLREFRVALRASAVAFRRKNSLQEKVRFVKN
jgi:hypothetical protein